LPSPTSRCPLSLHDALPIFAEGAWLVAVAIPLLVWMFVAIHRHYEIVARSLSLDGITPYPLSTRAVSAHSNVPVTVLLNSLNRRSEEHTSELQSRENLVCRL